MKEVNLQSLVHAFKGLSKSQYKRYFEVIDIDPKENELEDLKSFIKQLRNVHKDVRVLDNYFFGYTIPQISKEFDLLRFGNEYIVNVELKSENTGSRIFKQLEQNHYYLSFLGKKIYSYTYVSSEKQLYALDDDQKLIKAEFKELFDVLFLQDTMEIENIDSLFDPSNYLVSPFNSTDKFMDGEYFLTTHQKEIKKGSIKLIDRSGDAFLSICGSAGTGKTLLTFDIAKEYIDNGHKVLVIHCGYLNEGHYKLIEEYEWDIIPIKAYYGIRFSDYSLIIMDEVQRIRPAQLKTIILEVKKNRGNCIFSYDKKQCLRNEEVINNVPQVIANETSSKIFNLTEKIRTNKEIGSFIMALFDKSKTFEELKRNNIQLSYFQDHNSARKHLKSLGNQGWKVINYTPSTRDNCSYDDYNIIDADTAHKVIGQEFDKVVAVVDETFAYNGKDLTIRNTGKSPYYHPAKMLFQIMTRTRKKLSVIIIDNEQIMERCLSILGHPLVEEAKTVPVEVLAE